MIRTTRRTAALLSLLAGIALWAPVPHAQGQEPIDELAPGVTEEDRDAVVHSWTLAPVAKNAGGEGTGRPNLSYEVAPGGTVTDEVTLFNYSNVPLTFRIYATDAFNNDDGGFDLLPGDQRPTGIGTWISVPQESLTVPARAAVTMPITLTVPEAARPGDYAGGILASSRAEGTGPDGKLIGVDRRIGPRVYLRVSGKLQPELSIEDLRATVDPSLNPVGGSAEVVYRILNSGNVRMAGTQQVSISGPFGVAKQSAPTSRIPELLPGESVELRANFDGVGSTGVAVAEVRVEPDPIGTDVEAPAPTARRRLTLAVPYGVIGGAVVLLLLRYSLRAFRRRQSLEIGAAPP